MIRKRKPKPSQIVSQATIVVTQTLDGRIYMNSGPLFPMGDTTSYACQTADSLVRMAAAIIAEGGAPGWGVLSKEYSEVAE